VATGTVVVLVLAGLAIIAVTAFAAWSLFLLTRPTLFVRSGDWKAARTAAQALEVSWLRVLGGVRFGATYTRALVLHLEGQYEASIEICEKLDDASSARSVALLLGANLVMCGAEPKLAVAALEKGIGRDSAPEDILLLALAKQSTNDVVEAETLFVRAGTKRPVGAWPRINEPVFHYLRGLYLMRTDRALEAKDDLEAAAAGSVLTTYVERARALLPPASTADVDPRSSLAGQVMDE